MFDVFRNNPLVAKIILALLILPFALWGVDSYFSGGDDPVVAKVAGSSISEREFQQQLAEQREELRQQLGERFDPELVESNRFRLAVLEDMVNRQLLMMSALQSGMTVPDHRLAQIIREIPAFKRDGQFDVKAYETLLRQQGFSPASFQESVRAEIVAEQNAGFFERARWLPQVVVDRAADLGEQERDVQQALISPEEFLAKVSVTDDEVRKYFDDNAKEFEVPRRVKLEYLVLDADVLAKSVQLEPGEIEAYFQSNAARFGGDEQRRASHILIGVDAGADAKTRDAARTRASKLLAEVRAGKDFALLASANSTDTGSAAQGGDLGLFGRGVMVKPFEDAVFALKPGQVSDLVETDFGFHIIKLTEVQGGGDLASVRPQVEAELKKQRSAQRFAELAEAFSDAVFEESGSLSSAADAVGAPIQTVDNLTRFGVTGDPILSNQKFLRAVFEDALPNKRNTEVVEVSPERLVAGRVVSEKPAEQIPFAVVQGELRDRLRRDKAAALAIAEGKRIMAELSAGKDVAVKWGANLTVSRKRPEGLPLPAMQIVFRAKTSPLPSYAAVEIPGQGYAMFRINRVAPPATSDPVDRRRYITDAERMMAEEEREVWLAGLRAAAKVDIRKERVEASGR